MESPKLFLMRIMNFIFSFTIDGDEIRGEVGFYCTFGDQQTNTLITGSVEIVLLGYSFILALTQVNQWEIESLKNFGIYKSGDEGIDY